jgi:hypothetical protein
MQQPPIIDLVSFLLGFTAATIFWWLIRALKVYLPRLKSALYVQAEIRRQRKLEGISRYIRQESLRRAQAAHLAAKLFSLDEILIPPRLLAPPDYLLDPLQPTVGQRIAAQVIPYIPDWPELSAPFPVYTLTAAQALSKGANIAVIGTPGCGRSIVLAHLASIIARHEPAAEGLVDHVPVFLHAMDIDFKMDEGTDPVEVMQRSLSKMVPVFAAAQLPKYTRELFTSGNAMLLIDGIDELPPSDLQEISVYLKSFADRYPQTKIALTASADYMDGLSDVGVFPLAVAAWNATERREFTDKWSSRWTTLISPEIEKRSESKPPEPLLLKTWLTAEPTLQTPLECTLRVWSAFAGDVQGPGNMDALLAYVLRLNHKSIPLDALSELAYNIFCSGLTALPYDLIEKTFIKYKPDQSPSDESSDPVSGTLETNSSQDIKTTQKQVRISSGENALNALLESGLLVESPSGMIRFAHNQIAGYLASCAYVKDEELPLPQKPLSSLQVNTLRYLAVQGKINVWMKNTLEQHDAPLYRNRLMVSRWLRDAPANLPWRSPLMRMLIQMVHSDEIPFHLRTRCLAAVVASNDESVGILLKQFLDSESDTLRQLTSIGCGASQQTKTTGDLIKRLNDPNPEVSKAACLSLGSFGTRLAFESMVDMLNTGEESLQLAAAETLAGIPEGADILRNAASSDHFLLRRAAIAGLAQIRESWSTELLEKIAIEDAQWVIRNAAAEALEEFKAPFPYIPRPMPQPHQAGWLIEYAGKNGKGIIPGEPATEYILAAVQNGTQEERLCALQYLRSIPDQAAVSALHSVLEDPSTTIQEAGYYALWQLNSRGIEVTNQFGF